MPNPVPDIIEVLGARLDGWKPEHGTELTAFLDSLPELMEKIQETVRDTLRDIIEDPGNVYLINADSDWASEPAEEITRALGDAYDGATEFKRLYHENNDFWIEG